MDGPRRISLTELFLGFAHLGVVSFGGAITWARRLLVDEKKWLSADDFIEILGIGQVLPGPNVVNASVIIGAREAGPAGALAALAGILLPPLAIVLVLVSLFARYGDNAIVRDALHGSALAGAGLVIGTGLAMALRLRGNTFGISIASVAFVFYALLRFPLLPVVAVIVTAGGIAAHYRIKAAR